MKKLSAWVFARPAAGSGRPGTPRRALTRVMTRARSCARASSCAAVAVARLGGRAALAGPLGGPPGEDANGDRVLAALAREQVDCTGCQRLAGAPTALSAILIDARGERMIATHRDDRLAAATPVDPAMLVASTDAVLADNRFPEFVRPICLAARARDLTVVLDADRPTQVADELLRIATHVVFSSECLRATTGHDELGAGLARIAAT